MRIKLSKYQSRIYKDKSRFRAIPTGRRFGKSYLIATEIASEFLQGSGKIILYLAPSYKMAKKTMWYYLNTIIPKSNILERNKSELSYLSHTGNIIYLSGSHNYDGERGYPRLDNVYLDETGDQPEEIWEEVVRPGVSNAKGRVSFWGTPKGKNNWFYDVAHKDYVSLHQYTTLQGGFVDTEEVNRAKKEMDEKTFRQEFEASFELEEGMVYYTYSDANNKDITYNPAYRTVLCWDFNINPASCVINQEIAKDVWCVTKEFYIANTATREMCEIIGKFFIENGKPQRLEVTGDYSGNQRHSTSAYTDYLIIEQYFNKLGYDENLKNYERNVRPTRHIKNRINAINSRFKSMDNIINQYVNQKLCKNLDRDIRIMQWKENGIHLDDKRGKYGHISDALSYHAWNYYPITHEWSVE